MVDKQLILDSVGPVQAVLDAHDGVVNVVDTTDGVIMMVISKMCLLRISCLPTSLFIG